MAGSPAEREEPLQKPLEGEAAVWAAKERRRQRGGTARLAKQPASASFPKLVP